MYLNTQGNAKLYYEITGAGAPLIMIHGNSQNHDVFSVQAAYFSQYYKVISVDSRAHGESTHGDLPLSLDLLVQDIYDLIHFLNADNLTIIGYSDDANIAIKLSIRLALEQTISLYKLILISPNFHINGLKPYFKWPLKLIKIITQKVNRPNFLRHYLEKLALMAENTNISYKSLSTFLTPVLILSGEFDIIHRYHLEEIQHAFANATLQIVEKTGHAIIQKRNLDLNHQIHTFLKA